jgi:elongation factor G
MQVESPDKIRNLALAGHSQAGKTTLASGLLYTSGATNRMTKVEEGNAITDFDPEEQERGISINLGVCFAPWRDTKVNLLDCPGYGIFFSETQAGMRAADATLLCVSAVAGIEVNTEKVWGLATEIDQPVFFYLSKMDRERADFERIVEQLRDRFDRAVVPLQLPLGRESNFEGIVNLVDRKAYRFERDGSGKGSAEALPGDLEDAVEEWRNQLIELVAETDDALLETYFDEGTLTEEQLHEGLRRAIRSRRVFPLVLGSGLHNQGSSALLDVLVDLAPSPVDRGPFPAFDRAGEALDLAAEPAQPAAALVFKTMNDPFSGKISIFRVTSGTVRADATLWNFAKEESERVGHVTVVQGKQTTSVPQLVTGDVGAAAKLKHTATGDTLTAKERPARLAWVEIPEPAISFAIEPKSKGDEEKIGEALHRLLEEDPSLAAGRDPQTGEYLLSGTGQLHVEIAVNRLKNRYKVEVILHPPKVPYRETIRRPAEGRGRHKKQTGGRGQFADCSIAVEPLPRGGDFEFVDEIFGGSIPQTYRPAVAKGIQEARRRGYLAGYPVVDFRVRLQDGQYHDVDSSEMAFKIAGSLAFKDALSQASAVILEPIMKVEVTASEEYLGDIMGDLSQRRGRPQGMDSRDGVNVIHAMVPMAEMLNYAPSLRSMTQGRASFHMELSHYEDVPRNIQEKLIEEWKRKREEG